MPFFHHLYPCYPSLYPHLILVFLFRSLFVSSFSSLYPLYMLFGLCFIVSSPSRSPHLSSCVYIPLPESFPVILSSILTLCPCFFCFLISGLMCLILAPSFISSFLRFSTFFPPLISVFCPHAVASLPPCLYLSSCSFGFTPLLGLLLASFLSLVLSSFFSLFPYVLVPRSCTLVPFQVSLLPRLCRL